MKETELPDRWAAVRTAFGGDDLDTVFRFRAFMPVDAARKKYSTVVIVRWPYAAKKDGMPKDADLKKMSAFEDELEAKVEKPAIGVQAATLTGNGRRTWRYYTADSDRFVATVEPILRKHGPAEAQTAFRLEPDPEWQKLADLHPLLACADEGEGK